ncbi:hypothetical protein ACTWPT_16885 [Nonomuraea sp. 3N208]|uniref:hypothetical protein n=1 Tax=Nonomuraea sp. 3N208 TaxID=3457421 RepID=UPI003FCC8FB8
MRRRPEYMRGLLALPRRHGRHRAAARGAVQHPLSELADTDPVVLPGVDQEVAAWRAVQHRESSLAVVGEGGRFHGLVPRRRSRMPTAE